MIIEVEHLKVAGGSYSQQCPTAIPSSVRLLITAVSDCYSQQCPTANHSSVRLLITAVSDC